MLGVCREHGRDLDVRVRGYTSLTAIADALKCGKAHYAKEITVLALVPNRAEQYKAIPVAASGTCKKDETANSLLPYYREVIKVWYNDARGYEQRGPIANY